MEGSDPGAFQTSLCCYCHGTGVLSVLDRMGIRLNVVEKDNIADLERLTFAVSTTSKRHVRLLQDLRESDAADEVVVFRDTEEE